MRPRQFYIAKVNIHGNIFSQDLTDLISVHIPRVILNPSPVKLNSWTWSFTDIEKYPHQDQEFIIGNVTKSKYKKQKYRIGSKTVEQKTENEVAETAFFVYDPINELLVHESTGAISAIEFRNLFTHLLSNDPYVGKVVIKPIPIPYRIHEELLSIDTVTRITFHLIHPNPGKPEFNLYNEIIHEAELKELSIDMENKDGINIKASSYNDEETNPFDSLQDDLSNTLFDEQLDIQSSLSRDDQADIQPNPSHDDQADIQPNPSHDDQADIQSNPSHDDQSNKVNYVAIKSKIDDTSTKPKTFIRTIDYGIDLVESGYGEIKFAGFNNKVVQGKRKPKVIKQPKRFNSSNSVRTIKITENNPTTVLERLFAFIRNVSTKL